MFKNNTFDAITESISDQDRNKKARRNSPL